MLIIISAGKRLNPALLILACAFAASVMAAFA
jgi:hypothetical protein